MILQLLTKKYPGMRLWLSQRLSALLMAVYILALLLMLIVVQPANYLAWHDFFAPIWMRFATSLFCVCLIMHAWLGVADVLKDYVFNQTWRAYLQVLVDILLIIYLLWMGFILWAF